MFNNMFKKTINNRYGNNFSSKERKISNGFSLIETLVAISILVLIITGPLVLVNKSLTLIKIAKKRVIASYLAQEGVEYARNIRDENLLKGNDWLSGMDQCIDNKCTIDAIHEKINLCSEACDNLKFNKSKKFYNQESVTTTNIDTKFKREISLKELQKGEEVSILVEVSWEGGNSVKVEDILLNWF